MMTTDQIHQRMLAIEDELNKLDGDIQYHELEQSKAEAEYQKLQLEYWNLEDDLAEIAHEKAVS